MVPLKNLISQDTFPGPAMIPDSNVVKYCFGNCDIYYLCSSTCWFVILTLLRSGKPLTRLFRFTAGKASSELEGSGYFHLSKRYWYVTICDYVFRYIYFLFKSIWDEWTVRKLRYDCYQKLFLVLKTCFVFKNVTRQQENFCIFNIVSSVL